MTFVNFPILLKRGGDEVAYIYGVCTAMSVIAHRAHAEL